MSGVIGDLGNRSGIVGFNSKTWTLLYSIGAQSGENTIAVPLNRDDSRYFLYKIYINQWNVGNYDFYMRIFQDGDGNVKTASNYQYQIKQWGPDNASIDMHNASGTAIQLANNADGTGVQNQWTEICVQAPENTANYPQGMVFSTYNDDTGALRHAYGAWLYKSAGAWNSLQFYSEGSNSMAWDSAKVYGLPK